MSEAGYTRLRISNEVKARFDKLGVYGDSADDILLKIVEFWERQHGGLD